VLHFCGALLRLAGRLSPDIFVLWSGRWRCALFERKSKYSGIFNLITPACRHCSVLVEYVCGIQHLTFRKTQSRLIRVLYSKRTHETMKWGFRLSCMWRWAPGWWLATFRRIVSVAVIFKGSGFEPWTVWDEGITPTLCTLTSTVWTSIRSLLCSGQQVPYRKTLCSVLIQQKWGFAGMMRENARWTWRGE